MRSYKDDCVHYNACVRMQKHGLNDTPHKVILMDCWNCGLFVSRHEMMDCFWGMVWMGGRIVEEGKKQQDAKSKINPEVDPMPQLLETPSEMPF